MEKRPEKKGDQTTNYFYIFISKIVTSTYSIYFKNVFYCQSADSKCVSSWFLLINTTLMHIFQSQVNDSSLQIKLPNYLG